MKCAIYPFALVSEVSTLDCIEASKACEQWLWWNGKPSASQSWSKRCEKVNWMQHLYTRIFTGSRGQSIEDAWISSLADSPASRSVSVVAVKRPKTQDTFGPSSLQGLLFSNLGLASSRMLKGSLQQSHRDTIPFFTMSCATWKDWVSDRQQDASQRKKQAHRINGTAGSYLAYPTPTASMMPSEGGIMALRRCVFKGTMKVKAANAFFNYNILKARADLPTINTYKDKDGLHLPTDSLTNGKSRTQLNAAWLESLMGFPVNWTMQENTTQETERSATQSCQQSQRSHSQPYGTN